MKVYEIAAVKDCGSYYEVEYLTSSLSQDFLSHGKFLGLNNITAQVIANALAMDLRPIPASPVRI